LNCVSGPNGSSLIGPHKCTISCAKQELGIDQSTEQRITRSAVETPKPLRLSRRQSQSGHLDVLALNASQYVVKRLLCWHWWSPQFPIVIRGRMSRSNPDATRPRARLVLRLRALIANETSGLRLSPSLNHFVQAFYAARTCTTGDVTL
jgi:hypothetical protein